MKYTITLALFFYAMLISADSFSQNLNVKLSKVSEDYAKAYVKPGIDGIGSNINSGFFNTAEVPFNKSKPVEFNFNFSLKFFGSFFPSSSRSFNLSYTDSIETNGVSRQVQYSVTNAPTIIGNTNEAIATGFFTDNGDIAPPQELIGGVLNTSVVPLFFPQFQFGTIYGTDAAIRFLPKINVGDYGSFSFFGFAIRHNLDHYFKNSPINFAIQAGYQINNIDDDTDYRILSGTDYFVNFQASKNFTSLFTLYGALQLEKYEGEIDYVYVQDPNDPDYDIPVSFTQIADDKFRVILGGNINFGYFNFNIDANISNRFTLTTGIGVGF
jgi:hypothetical protein